MTSNTIRLYRGLKTEYSDNYDIHNHDGATNGYECWIDNFDIAKRFCGNEGYVYYIDFDKKDINYKDIYDENGERSLIYYNKHYSIDGLEGEEYMLNLQHNNLKNIKYTLLKQKEDS